MHAESDRGVLLVGLSQIDQALGDLLLYFLSLKGACMDAEWLLDPTAGNRPLGSLAIRTRIALCLGQIDDETRRLIDTIRQLRNIHAHQPKPFMLDERDIQPLMRAWPKKDRDYINKATEDMRGKHGKSRPTFKLMLSTSFITLYLEEQLALLRDGGVGVKIVESLKSIDKGNDSGINA